MIINAETVAEALAKTESSILLRYRKAYDTLGDHNCASHPVSLDYSQAPWDGKQDLRELFKQHEKEFFTDGLELKESKNHRFIIHEVWIQASPQPIVIPTQELIVYVDENKKQVATYVGDG